MVGSLLLGGGLAVAFILALMFLTAGVYHLRTQNPIGFSRGETTSAAESGLSDWSVESLTGKKGSGMVGGFFENGSVFKGISRPRPLRR